MTTINPQLSLILSDVPWQTPQLISNNSSIYDNKYHTTKAQIQTGELDHVEECAANISTTSFFFMINEGLDHFT